MSLRHPRVMKNSTVKINMVAVHKNMSSMVKRSVVKSTCCSFRGLGFDPWHSHWERKNERDRIFWCLLKLFPLRDSNGGDVWSSL